MWGLVQTRFSFFLSIVPHVSTPAPRAESQQPETMASQHLRTFERVCKCRLHIILLMNSLICYFWMPQINLVNSEVRKYISVNIYEVWLEYCQIISIGIIYLFSSTKLVLFRYHMKCPGEHIRKSEGRGIGEHLWMSVRELIWMSEVTYMDVWGNIYRYIGNMYLISGRLV